MPKVFPMNSTIFKIVWLSSVLKEVRIWGMFAIPFSLCACF
ncbi:unnamed protein product [Spirodela intermedia]|uniref:Uncharacterized protein n=1 Tax=Spirodela intermedia TaxID=51605 RepID=A0A7I8IDB9_SPIIN|nr:unnamed protein product [Spirodela intermedia]CAA6655394.1 unnamed protein product [Spirodela intermedia]